MLHPFIAFAFITEKWTFHLSIFFPSSYHRPWWPLHASVHDDGSSGDCVCFSHPLIQSFCSPPPPIVNHFVKQRWGFRNMWLFRDASNVFYLEKSLAFFIGLIVAKEFTLRFTEESIETLVSNSIGLPRAKLWVPPPSHHYMFHK